jgi:hypothetical protein
VRERGTSPAERHVGRPKGNMRFALLLIALTGCPDSGNNAADLVGTWREELTSIDTRQPDLLTVNADGSFRQDTDQGTILGTYEADSTKLTIRSGEGTVQHETIEDYVLDGDQLIVGALLPTSAIDGLAGTWHGDELVDETDTIDLDLDVRSDGSVHYSRDSTKDGHEAYDGQWSLAGGDFVTTLQVGMQPLALHWKAIIGRAVGNPMFTRVH